MTRITNQMMMQNAHRNLQQARNELSILQDKGTSRKEITRPSDDPAATAAAMRVRAQQASVDQYSRNMDDGIAWLATVESSLATSSDLMRKAQSLVMQGATDTNLSPTAREAIAVELESIRKDLFSQANTQYLGRAVFAGNSDAGVAYRADLSHTGAPGSTVQRQIGPTTSVRVDADGPAVFGEGADSLFALLDTIVTDLRAGQPIGGHLDALGEGVTAIVSERAVLGSRYAQLERGKVVSMEQAGSLENQRVGIEQVDLAEIILDLKMQEIAYQTALSVTSRALQPTLMSFLS